MNNHDKLDQMMDLLASKIAKLERLEKEKGELQDELAKCNELLSFWQNHAKEQQTYIEKLERMNRSLTATNIQ